ncbi:MAG: methylmalonyl-CoA epimerase [Chloroflexota bacterium]|nr:methylmalonyl-CoA epimerase [Chloroflexota bacterium]
MSIILHITKREQWEQAKLTRVYRGDTLDSEGFIHCSTPQQVIKVANAFYHNQKGLVLLCIETAQVQAEIRYEGLEGGERFPHIYGSLNTDAVVTALDFEPDEDASFRLPREIARDTMGTSIHHIAIAVRDLDAALEFYSETLGLEITGRREEPNEGVEIAFLPAGDAEIELLRPLDEESGVARFLDKRGEGLHHICLEVEDIEMAMERLQASGAQLLSEKPQVGVHGTRYVFVHPKSAHGVLLELYEGTKL